RFMGGAGFWNRLKERLIPGPNPVFLIYRGGRKAGPKGNFPSFKITYWIIYLSGHFQMSGGMRNQSWKWKCLPLDRKIPIIVTTRHRSCSMGFPIFWIPHTVFVQMAPWG